VWAVTSTGRVLRSDDDGDTWTVYKDFGNTYPLNRVSTPSAGGLWVFGGRGDVATTLIQYDALLDGNWHSVSIGGQLTTDLVGASSSITIAEATSTKWGELAVIFKGAALANDVAIFYTDNVHGDGSDWLRATGLDASLVEGRYIVGDGFLPSYLYAAFNNRDTWATVDGVAWTKTANVLPANCVPWHAYYIGWMMPPGLNVHLIAVENTSDTSSGIYKTADGFLTAQVLWPATGFTVWPASAKGKMAKVGAVNLYPELAARIAIVHDVGGATTWDVSYPNATFTSWLDVALPANVTHDRPLPICLTSLLWFVANVGGFPRPNDAGDCNREMARTQDGGAIWDSISVGDETCTTHRAATGDEINYFSRICRDAGGRLWAARQRGTTDAHPIRAEIYYSDDDGDTWIYSAILTEAGINLYPITILAHPLNQNIVALIAYGQSDKRVEVRYTDDRGASWATNKPTVASGNNFAHTANGNASRHMLLPNGRLVIMNRYATSSYFKIYTSDDYGGSWQLRYTESGTADEDNVCLFRQGQWLNNGQHLVGIRVPVQLGTTTDFAIMESTDAGTTWSARTVTNPTAAEDNDWDAVYDPTSDIVYVQYGADGITGATRVQRLRDATNAGDTWEDITGDLTVAPVTNLMHWDGIALIPN